MEHLRGKVAVVTGAASGIGFALAQRFAEEGMGVVLADVEEGALAAAAGRLRGSGAEVLDVTVDVRDASQVEALAGRAVAHFGAVHVVCNNAGVAGGGATLWDTPLETWDWVLGVNLWGVLHGIRSFVPRMLEQGEGHVVNTASVAGLIVGPGGPYNVSKFGVVALSESLFHGLSMAGGSVDVSLLCPGWVNTRIGESERNRPADLAVAAATDPMAERARRGVARVLEAGMPASEVAEKVVAAIRERRFYILPHDDDAWLAPIRKRMTDIIERRNPTPPVVPGADVILASLLEPD
ncbi:MAG: SDR family NAD(P)-dependent oxidoreductase [Acidimicrobiales bacterium]